MSHARTRAWAAAAAAAALGVTFILAGVVLIEPGGRSDAPTTPQPPLASAVDLRVDPRDPLALLVAAEPSHDGRWLALALDFERVAGLQSIYLLSLADASTRYVAEGVLAPQPWDAEGLLCYVDRSTAAPRAVWVDPSELAPVRSAPAAELTRDAESLLAGPRWARRTQTRLAEGGYLERIEWRGRERALELEARSLFDIELSARPGEVFRLRRGERSRALERHRLDEPGAPLTLIESEHLAQFRVAPDGRKVLVSERHEGRIRFSVRDTGDGAELAGPWSDERLDANWLARAGSRYLVVSVADRHRLVDLEANREVDLGEHPASALDVRVLADERILRRGEQRVDVLAPTGELVLSLFPPR